MDHASTPLQTKGVASRCLHVAITDWEGNLLLAPGNEMRNLGMLMPLVMPVLLYLCYHFQAPVGLWISAVLFPLFGVGGFLVGHFMCVRFGTRVVFDSRSRRITITGFAHRKAMKSLSLDGLTSALRDKKGESFGFENVAAIQLLDARKKKHQNLSCYHGYQLNLCLRDGGRYNLLDCGGRKRMDNCARALADYLRVDLIEETASDAAAT